MLITVFGGLSMLGGFVLLGLMGDTFSLRELLANSSDLVGQEFFVLALVLILLGAFTKSAQFPFYIWLPDAMEAPTPVSAYLHSATMVKAGLYLVARFTRSEERRVGKESRSRYAACKDNKEQE